MPDRRMADIGSFKGNQARKMPVVNVGTPKYFTAPYSFSTSIRTSVSPPTTAGLAMGRATLKKVFHGPRPRLRAVSRTAPDWRTKEARAIT